MNTTRSSVTGAEFSESFKSVHALIAEAAQRQPGRIAVRDEREVWTYAELEARANAIAHQLIAAGLTRGQIVALHMPKSSTWIASMLGVLKAGGAYLPLEPSHPRDRMASMLAQSKVTFALVEAETTSLELSDVQWIRVAASAPTQVTPSPAIESAAHDAAYVIFTSGSTGTPKGVLVEHAGVTNLSWAQIEAFRIHADSRVLQFAAVTFDASVSEIFTTLIAGAELVIPTSEQVRSPHALHDLLRERAISVVTFPPSLLAILPCDGLPALKTVVSAGEACGGDLVERWLGAADAHERRFINGYGPTEATVCASLEVCERGEPPTIGQPIANVAVHIIDDAFQCVPAGEEGEIAISGVGLARGYLGEPALTAQRFIHSEFAGRLYRTGDRGRIRADGKIEYLGRLDEQVKVRGFRVEPGEIEVALRGHPAVNDAVVVKRPLASGLTAYLVSDRKPPPTPRELREFLATRLPEYMLPQHFVHLATLPITPNGKVDRKTLPPPPPCAEELESQAQGQLETELIAMWCKVLKLPHVTVEDNFFDLGGDSLLAMRLILSIDARFKKRIEAAVFAREPTVKAVAALIQGDADAANQPAVSTRVTLAPGAAASSSSPLYLFHPIGGHIFAYAQLARGLGLGRRVVAFRAVGVEGEGEPLDRVELLAEHCLKEILEAPTPAVYLLAGWSFGGLIAFEVAQRLLARGHAVALALIDSHTKAPSETLPELDDDQVADMFARDFAGLAGTALRQTGAATSAQELLATLRDAAGQLGLERSEIERLFAVFRASLTAQLRYVARPIATPVLLVRPTNGEQADASDARWRDAAPEGLVRREVTGDHFTILKTPELLSVLEAFCSDADERHGVQMRTTAERLENRARLQPEQPS